MSAPDRVTREREAETVRRLVADSCKCDPYSPRHMRPVFVNPSCPWHGDRPAPQVAGPEPRGWLWFGNPGGPAVAVVLLGEAGWEGKRDALCSTEGHAGVPFYVATPPVAGSRETGQIEHLSDLMAAIRKRDHQSTLAALSAIFASLHGEHETRDQVVLSAFAVVEQAVRDGNDPHPETVENALNLLRGWIAKRLRAPAPGTGSRETAEWVREVVARIVDDYAGEQQPRGHSWTPFDEVGDDEKAGAYAAADAIIARLRAIWRLRAARTRWQGPWRAGYPMEGAHLRPSDGEPCEYVGLPCNKCGRAALSEKEPVAWRDGYITAAKHYDEGISGEWTDERWATEAREAWLARTHQSPEGGRPMSETKTVRVRIAVAVSSNGRWSCAGWQGGEDKDMQAIASDGLEEWDEAFHWIEADVPVPQAQTVEGTVTR